MDWTGIGLDIFLLLLPLLGMAATALLAFGAKWIATRVHGEQMATLVHRLAAVADIAARKTAQTYVDDVKSAVKDGKLTQEERQAAVQRAEATMRELLGPALLDQIYRLLGPTSAVLQSYIEAEVHALRAENKR